MGEISKSICGEYGHDNVASSLHLLSGDWCWLSSGPLYLLPRSTPTPPAPGPVSWPQGELSSALLAAVPITQVTPHDPCLSCWLVAGWAELLIDFYLIFTQIVKYFTLDIYWLSLVVDILYLSPIIVQVWLSSDWRAIIQISIHQLENWKMIFTEIIFSFFISLSR